MCKHTFALVDENTVQIKSEALFATVSVLRNWRQSEFFGLSLYGHSEFHLFPSLISLHLCFAPNEAKAPQPIEWVRASTEV